VGHIRLDETDDTLIFFLKQATPLLKNRISQQLEEHN